MKSLVQYITEEFQDYELTDLSVYYDVKPEELIIKAPDKYSESDIQIYLDDVILSQLPSNADLSKKFFSANASNIYDAYFEYSKFEHIQNYTGDVDFDWDSHYDTTITEDTLTYFKISKVYYIIKFDKFKIRRNDTDSNEKILEKIFKACESNDANKYPVEIHLDMDKLKYKSK